MTYQISTYDSAKMLWSPVLINASFDDASLAAEALHGEGYRVFVEPEGVVTEEMEWAA